MIFQTIWKSSVKSELDFPCGRNFIKGKPVQSLYSELDADWRDI